MPTDLEFTGERFLPGIPGEIAYEHWHRYAFAKRFVGGKRVADIACGEGYGSALLAGVAATVVGVDLAADAIAHARSHYAALSNVRFERASVEALPLADASVDVVVSFETVEHLPRGAQPRMFAEFARVLAGDGILVLSTPNPEEYSLARNYANPFHYYELPRAELEALLGTTFPAQRWFRQRRYFGSAIWGEMEGGRFEALLGDSREVERAQPPAAMYFILVAGRSVNSPPPTEIALSLFSDRSESELARLDGQIRTLEETVARVRYLDEILVHREVQLAGCTAERDALALQITASVAECRALSSALAAAQEDTAAVRGQYERHIAVLERAIAYRQSARWWLKLPWVRVGLLWQGRGGSLPRLRRRGGPATSGVPAGGALGPAGPALAAVPLVTSGAIETPSIEAVIGTAINISGWALDTEGIRKIEVRVDGKPYLARYGIPRPDVAETKPGFPDSAASGFSFDGDFADLSPKRHDVAVVAISRSGRESVLGRKGLVPRAALEQWRSLYESRYVKGVSPFYIVPATSAIELGGAAELDNAYSAYLSPTFKVGLRVPVLYLRTTLGAEKDWVFDPDWNVERRCGLKRIAEDSLSSIIAYSRARRLPVLFTLNGGIWADAACDAPDWDVNDHLEQDVDNCQWNEHNEVMPDNYLQHTAGTPDGPEIARSLTFNVYAEKNHHYKRRNLQAAARLVMAFAREDPDLFIGIALDADTYINPFFDEKQWYDYNPGTLRQFRHWLAGDGPYAGPESNGLPDLSAYRRKNPLSLAEVGELSGQAWSRWDEVDPPRAFPREGAPFWEDPWTHEWEVFRRHLVQMHYDVLSDWLIEAGVPKDAIYSSQGFIAPHPSAFPFALHIESPPKNYDSGGMSVEGAIPRNGHLGAIVYGPGALNQVRVEEDANLFATFHKMDPGWAVVEFNTADLRHPDALPTYAMGYRALREMFNYGARFASPMAWNGSNGIYAGEAGFLSFTAWRNTPLEDALRDFAIAHAFVPLGTRLWTFGSSRHADDDGWSTAVGKWVGGLGYIEVMPEEGRALLVSPAQLALRRGESDLLVLGLDPAIVTSVEVDACTPAGSWHALATHCGVADLESTSAGLLVPLIWARELAEAGRIRIALQFRAPTVPTRIRHIALYPSR